ncbi:uncharacterized protein [Branchiostoma lanceolatum]|uniref:uncharacterized protein isoform X1 n=1 Tax=Branchiostoma lanceolatum TaxID=7740 RepID=UPI003453A187
MPRPERQRKGFRGIVLPLKILQDNGTTKRVRSVYRQDGSQISSADVATTTLPQPAATTVLGNNDSTTTSACQSAEAVPDVSRHQRKKEQEKDAWADQREELIQTGMNLALPPTEYCYYCEKEVTSPIIYCQDCSSAGIFCLTCYETCHKSPSLHCPLVWKNGCFQPYVERKTLCLPRHKSCSGATDMRSLRVFDQTGRLQYVDVVMCTCESELSTLLQLGLWGATPTKPQTAFSVELLEWLCSFSMVSHVSVEAFCQAVRWKNRLTLDEKKTLHRALTGESIAEYQHYRDRLTSMQDLSPLLDDDTNCTACSEADGEQIVAIDGNFGLVRKTSSGVSAAPPLHGTTMFLQDSEVKDFLGKYNDAEKPPEDCSNFKAGDCLRSKAQQKKLDVTGVFGAVCRHDIPLKFMNMFHGERFGYPVYLIKHLLDEAAAKNVRLKVIYDISCSLASHIAHTKQAEALQLRHALEAGRLNLAVDVFHSYGHQSLCQVKYSTRRLSGYGLTDGEGTERLWSALRPFSRMTKEMSPDHRVDKLTDALRHYSRRKVVDIDVSLDLKLDKAIKAEKIAEDNLQQAKIEAGGTFTDEDVKAWQEMEKVVMARRKTTSTSSPKWKKDYVAKLVRYDALGKRPRTDMREHTGTLVDLWNQGMTQYRSEEGKRLVDHAVMLTGLRIKVIKDWIDNRKKKVVMQQTAKTPKAKSRVSQRKQSGFSCFFREKMKGPATTSTNKERFEAIHDDWKALDKDTKEHYEEQADQIKAVTIKDLSEEGKITHSHRLINQLHSLSEDFKDCGLEMAVMLYSPTPSPGGVQFAGTQRGRQYLSERAGNLHFDFLTAMNDGNTSTSKSLGDIQKEVRAVLNEKYAAATNTNKKFPYKDYEAGKAPLVVHGMPEGVKVIHIASMKMCDLQRILQEKEKIEIEMLPTDNMDTDQVEEHRQPLDNMSLDLVEEESQATDNGEGQGYRMLQGVQATLQHAMTTSSSAQQELATVIEAAEEEDTSTVIRKRKRKGSGKGNGKSKGNGKGKGKRKGKASLSGQGDLFFVEKLLDKREMAGVTKYYVKWKDYPYDQCTWEPEANISQEMRDTYDS